MALKKDKRERCDLEIGLAHLVTDCTWGCGVRSLQGLLAQQTLGPLEGKIMSVFEQAGFQASCGIKVSIWVGRVWAGDQNG